MYFVVFFFSLVFTNTKIERHGGRVARAPVRFHRVPNDTRRRYVSGTRRDCLIYTPRVKYTTHAAMMFSRPTTTDAADASSPVRWRFYIQRTRFSKRIGPATAAGPSAATAGCTVVQRCIPPVGQGQILLEKEINSIYDKTNTFDEFSARRFLSSSPKNHVLYRHEWWRRIYIL